MTVYKYVQIHCDRCQNSVVCEPHIAETIFEARHLAEKNGWLISTTEPMGSFGHPDKDYCPKCRPFIEAGLNHSTSCACDKCQIIREEQKP